MPQQQWDVTDPQTGRSIVITSDRQPTEAEISAAFAQPSPQAQPTIAKRGMMTPKVSGAIAEFEGKRKNLVNLLPTLAAMGAAPFTGGMSIPAAMAVTGGAAALGSGARSLLDDTPETPAEAGMTAAKEGVLNAGLEGVGGAIRKAAPAVKQGARRMWQWASDSISDKTGDAVLSRGAGTLTKRNLASLESPRSPTGAFRPREVSPTVIETMRSGVDRAGSRGGVPTSLGGLATAAFQPRPVSFAAQKLYNLPVEQIGKMSPQAVRAALLALLSGDDSGDTMRPMPAH